MAAEGAEVKEGDDQARIAATTARRVDPLVLLRESTMSKTKVRYDYEYLDIGDYRVHRNTKCAFRLSRSDPFLDIGSVWYMFNQISGNKSYTQESARKHRFTYIGVASRGDLCDYLAGKVETCSGIVQEVIDGRKRPREEDRGETPMAPRPKKASSGSGMLGEAGAAPSASSRSKPGQASELSYADVAARVRPVKDLDILVRLPGRTIPNADLILKIARDEVQNWHRQREAPVRAEGKLPLFQELEEMLKHNPEALPIILVPCSKSAPVNILNAVKLLQDGEYSRPSRDEAVYFESQRSENVKVVRNMHGKQWTFEVRDSTKGFTKSMWLRVVAVVTDGNDWQFKGWPFANIVDLFTTVQGIYFKTVDTAPRIPVHVTQWSIAILPMTVMQLQHRFGAVRDAFWTQVEAFLNSERRPKFVNHTSLDGLRKVVHMTKPVL
eukprot:TRINITY_DN47630_c0_g1_i1.p1 TRINITY_DN47630_c0_g1~~TRINITY_DN47630_c0_g1_i1.p1  ORF type:complete len:439 (+),score=39.43 TRINITY_DN47630_c0_g1_i1:147-1463(+)